MALKKYQKTLLYAVPILIGAYLIYRQFRKGSKKVSSPVQNPYVQPSPTPSTNTTTRSDFPLKLGSKNNFVKSLQWMLNNATNKTRQNMGAWNPANTKLVEDGIFGAKTESALKAAYQGNKSVASEEELFLIQTYLFTPEDIVRMQEEQAWHPPMEAPAPTQGTGLFGLPY
jgi:hypothetical protein